ncbi:glycosyltransferase family 2 protein [Salinimicrobium sp. HB62]|uniref:glycosyltransferase family 2 protein n=1 Tax=Salinimicrobium sp. HB62 TaxID=3077781 RepID=UPI002D76EC84|nr:glycosyltransferase [Salinimicrobium sp. HB62]
MDFQDFKKKYQKLKPHEYSNSVPSEPLVSICVQTYQHVSYIKDCLEGVLKQKTNFPFEILVGEDDSTDGTRDICVEYAERYPDKIRLFLHHRQNNIYINGRPTGRFNFIYNMSSARGKFIAFCEGDDYWVDPLKLQKQVDCLENNEDLVLNFHEAKIINNNETIQDCYVNPSLRGVLNNRRLKEGPYILPLTLCFRNVIKDFPEEFFKVLNGDVFLLSMLGNFGKGYFISDLGKACYRHHGSGMWSSQSEIKKLVNQLTTYYWLKVFYDKKGDTLMAQYFYDKYYSRSFYFMEHLFSFNQDLQVSNRFFLDKHYMMSFWYTLYKGTKKATGKGHFFRRKFLNSLSKV